MSFLWKSHEQLVMLHSAIFDRCASGILPSPSKSKSCPKLLSPREPSLTVVQVGMPVLGVVENMSGLQQSLQSFRFLLPGPNGAAQDVSEHVLKAVQASMPDSQVSCHITADYSGVAPSESKQQRNPLT